MIDLSPHHLETVKQILRDHVPDRKVKAFGSRATWTAMDYSDLDLLVLGDSELDGTTLSRLNEAFEESDLPMCVDVVDWHGISPEFRKLIEPSCVELPTKMGRFKTTLGDCASLVNDKVDPANCGDLPYIGLEHIGQGTLSLLGIGSAGDVESTKTAFRAGDILFGKLRPYFRKVVRPNFDGICSTDIWVVRPKAGVDAGYLFYLMASKAFVGFASQGSEGTRMPRAKWEHVAQYAVRLPSVSEQRAIAYVLGVLDDKIELNRRMSEALDAMAGMLFKSWFVDLDPVLARVPDGWHVRSLGSLLELVYGRALRADGRRLGSVPVYGSNGRIGWHDRKLVAGPGIVVGRKGNPGVVTWSQGDFFPIDTTFYVVPKGKVSLRFLFYALKNQKLQSIAADSAVPGLNRNIAYMSRQLVPSDDVMDAFDGYADGLLSRQEQLDAESRILAELRDTLLSKLISGEICVQDAEMLAEAAT